jgi:16S rRNA A1518/A1519 N6-dimethyltransferase RsmA/KsgA/DIM1 with predicted DNA glycosylase/AP lyase activity
MTIKVDPEENEIGALLDFVDLDGGRVLEIGSGDGRLTWRYAERAAQVTAVEPFAPAVMRAREHLPQELEGRVVLREAAFAEFAAQAPGRPSMSRSFPGLFAVWSETAWCPPSRRYTVCSGRVAR